MELSEEIKTSLGTFSPNPDDWTLIQRLGLEWGKKAFRLESENQELRELFVYFFGENYQELAEE